MSNSTQPPQLYPPPFAEEQFYLAPLPWLEGVGEAGDWDARDLLLARVVAGQVIFGEEQSEQAWHNEAGPGRPFFTRRTYERYRQRLLAGGWLRRYEPPARPETVTQVAWRDLQRGIKYTVGAWPGATWVYRPRTYLTERWPVWLGNADVAARVVLLALMTEANRLGRAAGGRLPGEVWLSWRQICAFAEPWLGDGTADPAAAMRAKVRKGVQELLVLGALREGAEGSASYSLTLADLGRAPQWSLAAMARQCQAEGERDGPLLAVVRDLMSHCWEPVTRLTRVWNRVQAGRRAGALLDEGDLLDLQKFLRTQRQRTPPLRHDHVLEAFFRQRDRGGARLVGGSFGAVAQEIQVVTATQTGEALVMPRPTAHGVAATQLWVRCVRGGGLTVAEAQEILAATRWVVWQEQAAGDPTVVVLVGHKPRALGVDFGYVIRANGLHGRIDYARPFEVLLRCNRADARLRMECRFRLLLA